MQRLARWYLRLLFGLIALVFVVGLGIIAYHEDGGKGLAIYFGLWVFLGSLVGAMYLSEK